MFKILRFIIKCKIIFHSSLDTKRKNIVSLKTLKMLEEIGEKVNNNIIIITSTIRYPQQQAEAMYSNLFKLSVSSSSSFLNWNFLVMFFDKDLYLFKPNFSTISSSF